MSLTTTRAPFSNGEPRVRLAEPTAGAGDDDRLARQPTTGGPLRLSHDDLPRRIAADTEDGTAVVGPTRGDTYGAAALLFRDASRSSATAKSQSTHTKRT